MLISASIVAFAAVFVAFTVVGSPGLGVGHFFYVPIGLLALATRAPIGAAGGVVAAALYALGIVLNPEIPPDEVLTLGTAIRLATYSGTGALLGWFASDNRRLVRELTLLAERDSLTGLPNTRAFESAIQRRLESGAPFALLIGDLATPGSGGDSDVEANDALLRLAAMLGRSLAPDDDLARVGADEFAVLATARSNPEAAKLAGRLENVLAAQGLQMTFGWAVHPHEGQNALSLYRAADERLYARKMIAAPLRTVTPVQAAS